MRNEKFKTVLFEKKKLGFEAIKKKLEKTELKEKKNGGENPDIQVKDEIKELIYMLYC